jgi:hypothetical protein
MRSVASSFVEEVARRTWSDVKRRSSGGLKTQFFLNLNGIGKVSCDPILPSILLVSNLRECIRGLVHFLLVKHEIRALTSFYFMIQRICSLWNQPQAKRWNNKAIKLSDTSLLLRLRLNSENDFRSELKEAVGGASNHFPGTKDYCDTNSCCGIFPEI